MRVLAGVSGQFFQDCNPVVPDARARDGAVSGQLLAPYPG
jgi:hypothetical protein